MACTNGPLSRPRDLRHVVSVRSESDLIARSHGAGIVSNEHLCPGLLVRLNHRRRFVAAAAADDDPFRRAPGGEAGRIAPPAAVVRRQARRRNRTATRPSRRRGRATPSRPATACAGRRIRPPSVMLLALSLPITPCRGGCSTSIATSGPTRSRSPDQISRIGTPARRMASSQHGSGPRSFVSSERRTSPATRTSCRRENARAVPARRCNDRCRHARSRCRRSA